MERKKLLIVEYPDNSSVVYEVPKEVEAVEEVTSEVIEYWNLKLRNKDGTYSWIRINSPSRGDEIVIRTFDRALEYKTTRDKVKKDEVTRSWVK
ncbi:hypothetical protein J7L06_09920 [Candidatus Bathyarchaeota archaeon]|nr:hypothetical protein [Candidatus Bathyarchaeota archaeon]